MTMVMGGLHSFGIPSLYACMEQFFYHNAINQECFNRLCGFHLYTRYGLETACSVYPEQRAFILAHRELTLEQVRRQCYKDLEKNPRRS